MKKFITFIIMITVSSFVFAACSQKSSSNQSPSKTSVTAAGSNTEDKGMKTFTKEELAKYDGKNGAAAYVAVDGKVYDVTNVKEWKDGMHKGHQAGKDYTKEITNAPHGKAVLSKLTVVGTYVQ